MISTRFAAVSQTGTGRARPSRPLTEAQTPSGEASPLVRTLNEALSLLHPIASEV